MKIYVASSWRNEYQQSVVQKLREANHEVYDFKTDGKPFDWKDTEFNWKGTTNDVIERFKSVLKHSLVNEAFNADIQALRRADVCILVLPCGNSAHLEMGWAVSNNVHTIIYIPSGTSLDFDPELMYKMCDHISTSIDDVIEYLRGF